jgi:hypothetical protein
MKCWLPTGKIQVNRGGVALTFNSVVLDRMLVRVLKHNSSESLCSPVVFPRLSSLWVGLRGALDTCDLGETVSVSLTGVKTI